MTISALEEARSADVLDRNFELYRDLSGVLKDRITGLKAGGEDPGCKGTLDDVKALQKVAQTVLELEASLVKRSTGACGGGVELDLDGARAEILARLARWSDGR